MIVTYQRNCLFGKIVNKEMQLNHYRQIADECWRAIPEHFPNIELGAYIIMPNHVHRIIVINENGMATNSSPSVGARHIVLEGYASSLPPHGAIVGSFKSAVTRRIGREFNATVWQRNYEAYPELVEGNT